MAQGRRPERPARSILEDVRKRLGKADFEKLAAFRYALRRFARFSEDAVRPLGLEPQQHQALLAVEGFPGRDWATLGELAEHLQIKPHSAVGLVDRLEKSGFLVRQPAPEDRRRVRVRLTPKGREVLEQLSAVHREELKRIGPHLKGLLSDLTGGGGA
jgi:DNA-binding MarR family transcriptional regulator